MPVERIENHHRPLPALETFSKVPAPDSLEDDLKKAAKKRAELDRYTDKYIGPAPEIFPKETAAKPKIDKTLGFLDSFHNTFWGKNEASVPMPSSPISTVPDLKRKNDFKRWEVSQANMEQIINALDRLNRSHQLVREILQDALANGSHQEAAILYATRLLLQIQSDIKKKERNTNAELISYNHELSKKEMDDLQAAQRSLANLAAREANAATVSGGTTTLLCLGGVAQILENTGAIFLNPLLALAVKLLLLVTTAVKVAVELQRAGYAKEAASIQQEVVTGQNHRDQRKTEEKWITAEISRLEKDITNNKKMYGQFISQGQQTMKEATQF